MKKFTKLFLGLLLVATFFGVTACSELSNAYVEEDGAATSNLTIEGLNGSFSGARTLFPGKFAANKVYYRLTGTQAGSGKALSDGTNAYITLIPDANGSTTVDIAPVKWNLVLTAYSDESCTKAVLRGKTYVDLTNGGDTVKFTLFPYGTEKGSVIFGKDTTNNIGSHEVTFDAGELTVTKYTIGLYNKDTDILITGTSETVTVNAASGSIFKQWTDIEQGEYNLKVIFYGADAKDTTKEVVINRYDELVIVVGGTPSEKAEGLKITNFLTKPSAPTNFLAELAEVAVTDHSKNEENYDVKFTWTDNADNESGFALTITEVGTDGTEVTNSIYTKTYTTADYNDTRFVDGSLSPNSKTVTISLPTGHLFAAAIKAVNEVDNSDAVYASSTTNFTSKVTVDSKETAAIGRFQVSYFLNSGSLVTDDDIYTGTYYEHATYGTDITILTLNAFDGDTTSSAQAKPYAYRSSDAKTTTKIVDLATEKTEYNSTKSNLTYSGVANLELKLAYDTAVQITIYEFKDISKDRISVQFREDGSSYSNITGKITSNGTIKVTVDGTDTSSANPDTYADSKSISKFYVEYYKTTSISTTKTGEVTLTTTNDVTSGEITISTENLDDGTYALHIYAYDENSRKLYDGTVYITLSRSASN